MKRIAILSLAALLLAGSLALPASAATDAEILVGRWQADFPSPIGRIRVDLLLNRNGSFSQLASVTSWHGTSAVRTVGRWYVVRPGWIRFHNDDWAPKRYKGKRIHMPATESHSYRILDRNRVRVDGKATYSRASLP